MGPRPSAQAPPPTEGESVAAWMHRVDRPTEEAAPKPTAQDIPVVEVLDENWDIVRAFKASQQTVVSTGIRPIWLGISAQEVQAAVSLLRIDVKDPDTFVEGVEAMAREAARLLNRK